MSKQQILHAPTLTTIKMVERTLQEMPDSLMRISELKRALPKQVNHNTLMTILDYLQESGKIVNTSKGIIWSHNDNPHLIEAIKRGTKH